MSKPALRGNNADRTIGEGVEQPRKQRRILDRTDIDNLRHAVLFNPVALLGFLRPEQENRKDAIAGNVFGEVRPFLPMPEFVHGRAGRQAYEALARWNETQSLVARLFEHGQFGVERQKAANGQFDHSMPSQGVGRGAGLEKAGNIASQSEAYRIGNVARRQSCRCNIAPGCFLA
ncbi:hypothetical protein AJ88_14670 [Mesorhizobium amorphae CCBAU 01583]|nr:hypothetical protein AJ88_14670 [Mesorhizobium amorphae CCBAU 01583]